MPPCILCQVACGAHLGGVVEDVLLGYPLGRSSVLQLEYLDAFHENKRIVVDYGHLTGHWQINAVLHSLGLCVTTLDLCDLGAVNGI